MKARWYFLLSLPAIFLAVVSFALSRLDFSPVVQSILAFAFIRVPSPAGTPTHPVTSWTPWWLGVAFLLLATAAILGGCLRLAKTRSIVQESLATRWPRSHLRPVTRRTS